MLPVTSISKKVPADAEIYVSECKSIGPPSTNNEPDKFKFDKNPVFHLWESEPKSNESSLFGINAVSYTHLTLPTILLV